MTYRVGIIGIGYGQHVLLPVFQRHPRTQVVMVCAATQARAAAVAQQHGITRATGDWRELVTDPEVDVVAIATPPAQQPAIAIAGAQTGKHLFLEKPLAPTLDEAIRMEAAVMQAGVISAVDFEFPQIAAWRTAREMLAEGAIGGLRHIEVNWNVETYANRNRLSNWKTQAGGGGTLYNFGPHVFYNLEWFTGQPIMQVTAHLSQAPSDTRPGDTVNHMAAVFADGLLASITVSGHSYMGSGHRWAFYGDAGTLVLHNPTRDYVHGFTLHSATRADDGLQPVPVPPDDTAIDGRQLATGCVIDRFIASLDGEPITHPTVRDGLRVQKLLHAAQRSHEYGQRQSVK
jgi:predicted dehydrogenase